MEYIPSLVEHEEEEEDLAVAHYPDPNGGLEVTDSGLSVWPDTSAHGFWVYVPYSQRIERNIQSLGPSFEEESEEVGAEDYASDQALDHNMVTDSMLNDNNYLDDGVFERLERFGPPAIQILLERLEERYTEGN